MDKEKTYIIEVRCSDGGDKRIFSVKAKNVEEAISKFEAGEY